MNVVRDDGPAAWPTPAWPAAGLTERLRSEMTETRVEEGRVPRRAVALVAWPRLTGAALAFARRMGTRQVCRHRSLSWISRADTTQWVAPETVEAVLAGGRNVNDIVRIGQA